MATRLRLELRLALIAAVAVLPAVLAVPAASACGVPRYAPARGGESPGRPPYILGDSTMLYAAPVLGGLGFEADAKGCRQFYQGVSMVAARADAGTLPHVVVLALGANGPILDRDIARVLRIMGRGRVLVLVTPRQASESRAAMLRAAARLPERVLLVDWVGFSAGRDSLFFTDGLHVTPGGAEVFSRLVVRAVAPYAFPPVRRLRIPSRARGARRCGELRRARRKLRVHIVRGDGRVTCERARELARRPLLRPEPGWRNYDWREVTRSSWRQVIVRADREVVIGLSLAR